MADQTAGANRPSSVYGWSPGVLGRVMMGSLEGVLGGPWGVPGGPGVGPGGPGGSRGVLVGPGKGWGGLEGFWEILGESWGRPEGGSWGVPGVSGVLGESGGEGRS